MTLRSICSAITVGLLTGGMVSLVPVSGRAQGISDLPEGPTTLVGCYMFRSAGDHYGYKLSHDKYVLMSPKVGPVLSVSDGACTVTDSSDALKLEGARKVLQDPSILGRWVQITGKLESSSHHGLREFRVESVTPVPVVPPVAAVVPPPSPRAELSTPPAPQMETPTPQGEQPVPTTGVMPEQRQLPATASSLPLVGLIGSVSLLVGLVLGLFRRRAALGRG